MDGENVERVAVERKNSEGYNGPTAYRAISNITAADREIKRRADNLVGAIKLITEISGFEIIGRVQLRHKKSGAEYK